MVAKQPEEVQRLGSVSSISQNDNDVSISNNLSMLGRMQMLSEVRANGPIGKAEQKSKILNAKQISLA